jgi:hypothetical protein
MARDVGEPVAVVLGVPMGGLAVRVKCIKKTNTS